jgi:hypothetical protein
MQAKHEICYGVWIMFKYCYFSEGFCMIINVVYRTLNHLFTSFLGDFYIIMQSVIFHFKFHVLFAQNEFTLDKYY